MGFDGTFGAAHIAGDLFVDVAANNKLKDFPLARRQGCDLNVNGVQFVLLGAEGSMVRERMRSLVTTGLGQEVLRARLEGSHRGRNVGIASEEYDRQR